MQRSFSEEQNKYTVFKKSQATNLTTPMEETKLDQYYTDEDLSKETIRIRTKNRKEQIL